MTDINELVRENLVRFRNQNKFTQIELSQKIGYSDKAISRWETGEVTPDVETLNRLAELYGISISAFFEKEAAHEAAVLQERRRDMGRRIASALLLIACLWYIVIIMFIRLDLNGATQPRAWLVFIWAIPVTFIISMLFSLRWGARILTLIFCSLVCWTLILALYLQFLDYNMFLLFPSGAPLQAIIILWMFVKPAKNDGARGKR